VVADPFHRTAELVTLLEMHAVQRHSRSRRHRLVTRLAWLDRSRRLALGTD
jgi:hypothetical protein